MLVAVVQTNPAFGEIEKNVNDAITLIERVNADLFVLPELFNTGYNFVDTEEAKKLSEPVDGYSFNQLSTVARKKNCYIVYGFAERADHFYNSAALIGPDGLCGVYRKVHLYY